MTGSLHTTPDDTTTLSEERFHPSGSSSRQRKSGFANASPTIAVDVTFSRSMASSIATGSNDPPGSVTTEPPTEDELSALRELVAA